MEEFAERLKTARKKAGYRSARKAAEALGMPESTYRAYEGGTRGISPETAEKFGRRFRFRPASLIFPHEPMYDDSSGQKAVRELTYHPETPMRAMASEIRYEPKAPGGIPEIDARAGAGAGQIGDLGVVMLRSGDTVSGHAVIREWNLPEEFTHHHLEITPGRTLILEVIGDSMLPTLLPGDRIVVDLSQTRFRADALYVIDDDFGEPSVKRLRRVAYSDPPTIEIISDNPTYGNDLVAADRVRIIGRVCGHMSRK